MSARAAAREDIAEWCAWVGDLDANTERQQRTTARTHHSYDALAGAGHFATFTCFLYFLFSFANSDLSCGRVALMR